MRGLNLCESNKALSSLHAEANGRTFARLRRSPHYLDWERVVIFDSRFVQWVFDHWDQETKDGKPVIFEGIHQSWPLGH